MNPIGRDQHVAACGHGLLRPVAPDEGCGDTMCVLRHIVQLMGGMVTVRANPCPCCLIEHPLELATVDGKLRIVIAGVETTRFAPEFLAEAVGVNQLRGAYSNAIERVQKTEICEFLDRVWEHIDADAEFTNAARLLEHLAFNADGVQAQRRRKPADTPAND
jgi:hypothetical protein